MTLIIVGLCCLSVSFVCKNKILKYALMICSIVLCVLSMVLRTGG